MNEMPDAKSGRTFLWKVAENGTFGLKCIGATPLEAQQVYRAATGSMRAIVLIERIGEVAYCKSLLA